MLRHGWVESGALAGVMEEWGGGMMGYWVVPTVWTNMHHNTVPRVNVSSTITVTLAI